MDSKLKLFKDLFQTVFGLFLFSFGVHLTIQASIGLAPWDALSTGVSYHTPFSYGIAHTIISLLFLSLDLLMREKIGCGTILDALLVGNFVDFFTWLGFIPRQTSLISGTFLLLAGLFIMALGQYFYMYVGLGCGPRDAFLIGLGKRLPRLPIGVVNTLILAVVLSAGWLLGAPIGLGTVLSTFCIGTAMQIVFRFLHFEPRSVVHHSLIETTQAMAAKA